MLFGLFFYWELVFVESTARFEKRIQKYGVTVTRHLKARGGVTVTRHTWFCGLNDGPMLNPLKIQNLGHV